MKHPRFRLPRRAGALAATPLLLLLAVPLAPVRADVDVSLDAETITELVSGLTPETVRVALPTGGSIDVGLSDLKVTGFDPAGGDDGKGHVLTSLKLDAPALGVSMPVSPRVSLDVLQENGKTLCLLRFQGVELPVPLLGGVDISRLMPPIRVPAEHLATATGPRGDMEVRSRLVDVRMGTRALQLRFDVKVVPLGGSGL